MANPIDATNYEPIDPIWRDFYRWRLYVWRDGTLLIKGLKAVIDRPQGTLRFGDIIVTPNYDYRIFLAYRYKSSTGNLLALTHDLIREGDRVTFERDGVEVTGIVLRRYNPADIATYLTLEIRETPSGTIEPLNP